MFNFIFALTKSREYGEKRVVNEMPNGIKTYVFKNCRTSYSPLLIACQRYKNITISVVIGGSCLEKVVRVPQAVVPTGELLKENLYDTTADLYRVLACPQGEVLYGNGRVQTPPYTEIPEPQPTQAPKKTMTSKECGDLGHGIASGNVI